MLINQGGSTPSPAGRLRNMDKPTCSVASFGQHKSAIVDLYKGTIDQRLSQELNMLVRSYAKIVAKKKRAGVMSHKEGILLFFVALLIVYNKRLSVI